MDPVVDYAQYLKDIRGLDPVSWWPPAPGWWLVAVLTILALVLLARQVQAWINPLDAWRKDAQRRLRALRRRLRQEPPREIASELSELLRRIAIARAGRQACAGLTDEQWLEWLTANDPTRFDWPNYGKLLLDTPYAPPDHACDKEQLRQLVDAGLCWVAASAKSGLSTPKLILRRLRFGADTANV